MNNLTPKQIVEQLDKFIIGQDEAKRAVAVAIRNRWRRQQLDPDMAREVSPKNIIMSGPTGVGKTEIARRIATLTGAPFIKIEATKFTEVGYHGRDVESMVRDLVEHSINMVRAEHADLVETKAHDRAEQRVLDLLLPGSDVPATQYVSSEGGFVATDDSAERREKLRQRMLEQLQAGELDEREVEITQHQKAVPMAMFSNMGMDQMDPDMAKMFENLIPDQTRSRRLPVKEAMQLLTDEEIENMVDKDKIIAEAIERAEQSGIIFLDEIDKVASTGEGKGGADVSRQGVQRDLLPIVEGTTVSSRHGLVNTEHILFVAAGAFHSSSVSDLMPELQGRFPIRVELNPLTKDDFVRILIEPDSALTKQQIALMKTEGIDVDFEDASIDALAEVAALVNSQNENIGARRLMTVMEKLFDEISFDAPEMATTGQTKMTITSDLVHERLASIAKDEDLSKFVL